MAMQSTADAKSFRATGQDGLPAIRTISTNDVFDALRRGVSDFGENPTHYLFMCAIFPIAGFVIAFASAGANLLPLIFPLLAGFALVGPFTAIGIYEISKRREQGLDPSWSDARRVLNSPAMGSIALMGALLLALFAAWLAVAYIIYALTEGSYVPTSAMDFFKHILSSPSGWALIIIGNLVGFAFAAFTLAISVVSIPLMLDREVDLATAIKTSVAATRQNPVAIGLWGLIVAVALGLGALPVLVGLAVVVPLLGHATWHLYRHIIV